MSMIASFGPNLPLDVLIASGRYAGPIPVDADRPLARSTDWLESKFAPWTKSVLEGWAAGELDHLDAVVFSRADDSSQRLYYYVCELQRRGLIKGPEAIIVDIAKIPRPSSVARTIHAVRGLCVRLGVSDQALNEAIRASNARRRAVVTLPEGRRCLIEGTPLPDGRLHRVVEAAGFVPVGDTLAEEWANSGPLIAEDTSDPAAAIGEQLHAAPIGPRSFADPAQELLARIKAVDAQAAIIWRIEEDEAQAWHLPAQRRALAETGVPSLILTRRDWQAKDGAAEEIADFLQSVTA